MTSRTEPSRPVTCAAVSRLPGRPPWIRAAPQRLVGVDVADAGRDGLVEQDPLDLGLLRRAPGGRRPASSKAGSSGSRAMCATGRRHRAARRRRARGRPPRGRRRSAGRRSAARARRRRRSTRTRRCFSSGAPGASISSWPLIPRWPTSRGVGPLPPGRQRQPQVLARGGTRRRWSVRAAARRSPPGRPRAGAPPAGAGPRRRRSSGRRPSAGARTGPPRPREAPACDALGGGGSSAGWSFRIRA